MPAITPAYNNAYFFMNINELYKKLEDCSIEIKPIREEHDGDKSYSIFRISIDGEGTLKMCKETEVLEEYDELGYWTKETVLFFGPRWTAVQRLSEWIKRYELSIETITSTSYEDRKR